MAGSKGRGTSRSMWELCLKIDPSHTHNPFKINKGLKMKVLHCATVKVNAVSYLTKCLQESMWDIY